MRTIDKQSPGPDCLSVAKRDAAVTGYAWPPLGPCPDAIRAALVVEQQGLCAYCMQRIKAHGYRSELHSEGGMKIEHWEDRSAHEDRMYDWDNLLGVCGGEYRGAEGLVAHCDTSRGAQPLVVHPATSSPPRPETAFAFQPTPPGGGNAPHRGVWVHAVDPSCAGDIDRLNLNARHLVQNRYGVREELQLALRRASMKGEPAVRALLRRRLASALQTAPATLPPFAPIVAEYVSKKMVSKGMQP